MRGRRILSEAGIALALAALAAALAAPGALADGGPPGSIGLAIGPIAVHKGFKLEIEASVCRGKSPLNVNFFRGKKDQVSYSYGGANTGAAATLANCHALALRRATISARWSNALRLRLHVVRLGPFVKLAEPRFCKGNPGRAREVTLAGTLSVAIGPRLFGRIRLHRVSGTLSKAGRLRCRPPSLSSELSLQATFAGGKEFLSAFSAPHGSSTVTVTESVPGPIAGVSGFFDAYMTGGRALFSAASDLSSAHIGAARPIASGSLEFHATAGCITSSAAAGTLTGTLTVADPLSGPLVLNGASAASVFITRGSASPPICAPSTGIL